MTRLSHCYDLRYKCSGNNRVFPLFWNLQQYVFKTSSQFASHSVGVEAKPESRAQKREFTKKRQNKVHGNVKLVDGKARSNLTGNAFDTKGKMTQLVWPTVAQCTDNRRESIQSEKTMRHTWTTHEWVSESWFVDTRNGGWGEHTETKSNQADKTQIKHVGN